MIKDHDRVLTLFKIIEKSVEHTGRFANIQREAITELDFINASHAPATTPAPAEPPWKLGDEVKRPDMRTFK